MGTNNKEKNGRGQKRKARVSAQPTGKGNIRNLLGNMPTKSKEVKLIVRSFKSKSCIIIMRLCDNVLTLSCKNISSFNY